MPLKKPASIKEVNPRQANGGTGAFREGEVFSLKEKLEEKLSTTDGKEAPECTR